MYRTTILAAVLACSFAFACSGADTRPETIIPEAPAWYDDEKPAGCGVGEKDYRGSRSLSRNAAVERARLDLARQIDTFIAGLMKDTREEGAEDDLGFSEDLIRETVKSVTAMSLQGSRVVKTAAMGSSYYALVCLDPEAFASAFDRMKTLSEKRRQALRKRSEEHFRELDAEIEKIQARD